MSETKIEWATHTSNWLAGCTKVSPACTRCYAETMTSRLASMPNAPPRYSRGVVADGRWTGRVVYDPAALAGAFEDLRRARKPRRVFANSMSDTFHDGAPPESLADLAYQVQHMSTWGTPHVLMLLTKRPGRMLQWQREYFPGGLPSWVWVGVPVEDQRRAYERVSVLLQVETAGVRFVSCEPLLGPVYILGALGYSESWSRWIGPCGCDERRDPWTRCDVCDEAGWVPAPCRGIGWVIAGGESGPGARPTHPEWVRSLRGQCQSAAVPFHFKQWGEWIPNTQRPADPAAEIRDQRRIDFSADIYANRIGKKAAGRLLDGRTWDEVPRV